MTPNHAAAIALARQGFRVFPVKAGAKAPPLTYSGCHNATDVLLVVNDWWKQYPSANVAVATGDGLVVVDIDVREDGDGHDTLAEWENANGVVLPPTACYTTPSGGTHYWYRVPKGIDSLQTTGGNGRGFGPHVDTRHEGGYVVVPPSTIDGKPYLGEIDPEEIDNLPPVAIDALRKKAPETRTALEGTLVYPDGTRNANLARIAGVMRRVGFDDEGILAALMVQNQKCCQPPLPEEDVVRVAISISRYPIEEAPLVDTSGILVQNEAHDIIPLGAPLPPMFPAGPFTGSVADIIEAASLSTETPREMAIMAALAACATPLSQKFVVSPKADYFEHLNMWTLCALESGSRKSAVIGFLASPLRQYEIAAQAAAAPAVAEYKQHCSMWQTQIAGLNRRAAKAVGEEMDALLEEAARLQGYINTRRVNMPVLLADDITVEAMAVQMAANDERLAILVDEAGPLGNISRYSASGSQANLDLFLKSYTGTPYKVTRLGREGLYLHHPSLTIGLAIQPSELLRYVRDDEYRSRGFWARFLVAIPQSTLGYRTHTTPPVSVEIRAAYATEIYRLLELPWRTNEEGKRIPHTLLFEPDAYALWLGAEQRVEAPMRDGGYLAEIRDWIGKWPGQVARIAGILHCLETQNPQDHKITAETMRRALTLGEALMSHALYVLQPTTETELGELAKDVWKWVTAERLKTLNSRAVQRKWARRLVDSDAVTTLLHYLVDHGHLMPAQNVPAKVGGKPSKRYDVNPAIIRSWDKASQKREEIENGNA